MAKAAAQTAAAPTAIIAIEQNFALDQRVIVDGLAYSILPFGARAVAWLTRPAFARNCMVKILEKTSPGLWALVTCRKRYIDERLIESLDNIDAMVNLGAGFDTRAYRLPALAGVPVWEVDQPRNIALKQALLRKRLGFIPTHVTLVPTDFDRQDLGATLTSYGY